MNPERHCLSRRSRLSRVTAALALVVSLATAGSLISPSAAGAHPDRSFTYEIDSRGNTHTDLGAFAAHVGETLDEPRGWSGGGAIAFHRVSSGGDFSVILATPAAVDRAAPGCSPDWSCRVGDEVLINEERWNNGTRAYDRPLDQYRHYVVNHEVGHWLGLGHSDCPGSAEPAPVMMQQSKGFDGCTSTVWPLEYEQEMVAARHGSHIHDDIALSDLLWYEAWNDSGVTVGLSTGSSYRWAGQWISGWGSPDWATTADVDSDGFGDLIWYETWNNEGVTIGLSDGERKFKFGGQWIQGLDDPHFAASGDVNGDGAADLVWYRTVGGGQTDVHLSTGHSFTSGSTWNSGWGAPDWAGLADVNGDGLDDLIWYESWNDRSATVALSNGDGFSWAGKWATGLPEPHFADTGDVDGDGDHDLVWYTTADGGTVTVYESTGSSFTDGAVWVRGWGAPHWAAVGDANLDGKADLAWYETWNHGGVTMGISDGRQFQWSGRWVEHWGTPDQAFFRNAG